MRRALPALLMLLLLCACAPSNHNVATGDGEGGTSYLNGVSSEYSIRLDTLPASQTLGPDTAMKQALIAGDSQIHVTTAVFHVGDNYAMDLIVNNKALSDVDLRRADVRIVDSNGVWFMPVDDFRGAADLGLRGKSRLDNSTYLFDDSGLPREEYSQVSAGTSGSGKAAGGDATVAESTAPPAHLHDFDWNSGKLEAPRKLTIPAGEGRLYWAYWKAPVAPVFPVTAFVTVDERHMIFVFEE